MLTEKQAKRVVVTVVILAVLCVAMGFYWACYEHDAAKNEMLSALGEAVDAELAEDPTFAERMATYVGAHSREEMLAAIEADLNLFYGSDWSASLDYFYYSHYFSNHPGYLVNRMREHTVSYLDFAQYYSGLDAAAREASGFSWRAVSLPLH